MAFGVGMSLLFLAVFELSRVAGFVTSENTDVTLYRHYGEAMTHGAVPYRDFGVEYPPGALPLFLVPALSTGGSEWYRRVFALTMLAAIAALLASVRLLACAAPAESPFAAPAAVAVLTAVLGSVALTRFDLVPAALTAVALAAVVFGRWRTAAVVLGIAIATKLYPAVLLPLVAIAAARRAGARTAATVTAISLAVVALAYAPFVILSAGGVKNSLDAQFSRPLEVESLGGSIVASAHRFFGLHLPRQPVYYDFPFHTAHVIADASVAIEVLLIVALWIGFARSSQDDGSLMRFSAAAVAVAVVFGKVLSPQYLIWLVALVPLVRGARGRYATAQLAAACVLTALVFPRHWEELKYHLGTAEVAAITARDLLLVGVFATLAWPVRREPYKQREPPEPSAADAGSAGIGH